MVEKRYKLTNLHTDEITYYDTLVELNNEVESLLKENIEELNEMFDLTYSADLMLIEDVTTGKEVYKVTFDRDSEVDYKFLIETTVTGDLIDG